MLVRGSIGILGYCRDNRLFQEVEWIEGSNMECQQWINIRQGQSRLKYVLNIIRTRLLCWWVCANTLTNTLAYHSCVE